MTSTVDVAIVGAGPYGLSVAAHLHAARVRTRVFGLPMHLWQSSMPVGMFLKSQAFASNLSDPYRAGTLAAYCRSTGRRYVPYGMPVDLATFTEYGRWFQRTQVPHLEEILVTHLARVGNGFELTLADGSSVLAHRVVVAAGVEHFTYLPERLRGLPRELCTHSSAHTDLGVFRGKDVTVVGGGQSALETAALANEQGANVRLVVRKPTVSWNGDPLAARRSLKARLREPEAALGSGWSTVFYSNRAGLFARLPASRRVRLARTALGPAGAYWLRPRVEGRLPVLLDHDVIGAEPGDDGLRLTLRDGGAPVHLTTQHLIAATGYRPDVRRLTFLDERLTGAVRTLDGGPDVDRNFQSSVPGLYFTGPAVATTFGPVMRFVHGCDFAARRLARRLTGTTTGERVTVGARS